MAENLETGVIKQAYIAHYSLPRDVLKAIHTLEGFNLPYSLLFTSIKLFNNGAEAERPRTVSSIRPLSHNRSRAIVAEPSNPENVDPSLVF